MVDVSGEVGHPPRPPKSERTTERLLWVGSGSGLVELIVNDRPLSFFMTAGQVSDHTSAAALLDDIPEAQWLLGDRGYDADWFRDALQIKGIQPCVPGRRSRNEPVQYDRRRYRRRSRIEIMYDRLKDLRRVATRYDRCPVTFFAAVNLAGTIIFWL